MSNIISGMNQEQGIELEFWEWREFWEHGRPISERRRLAQGETVPVLGEEKWFNGDVWKVTDTQTVVAIGTAGSPPVTLFFCEYRGAVTQSIS